MPILMLTALFFLYVKLICHFSSLSEDLDLICALEWKDGVFLGSSYIVIKFLSVILDLNTITKRITGSLLLYLVSYGIFAFPYMISSFFQPLLVNSFLHVLLMIFGIEVLLSKYCCQQSALGKE